MGCGSMKAEYLSATLRIIQLNQQLQLQTQQIQKKKRQQQQLKRNHQKQMQQQQNLRRSLQIFKQGQLRLLEQNRQKQYEKVNKLNQQLKQNNRVIEELKKQMNRDRQKFDQEIQIIINQSFALLDLKNNSRNKTYQKYLQTQFDCYDEKIDLIFQNRKCQKLSLALFQCPICSQEFNLKDRIPMMICANQHTYCQICITEMNAGKIKKCPQCRFAINQSTQNIHISRFLEEACKYPQKKEENLDQVAFNPQDDGMYQDELIGIDWRNIKFPPCMQKIVAELGPFTYHQKEDSLKKYMQPTSMQKYFGEISEGKKNGRGIQIWPDNRFYEGYWLDNKLHGKGRMVYPDGDVYEGQWMNGMAHGKGVYYENEGSIYDGEWVKNVKHGFGVEKWPDGSCYQGEYRNGMKNGKGKFLWPKGTLYKGQFMNDQMQGKGRLTRTDGRSYEGEFKDNKMHGAGVFRWPNGTIYEGQYFKNKKHGYGRMKWADGRQYEGSWKNGEQDLQIDEIPDLLESSFF